MTIFVEGQLLAELPDTIELLFQNYPQLKAAGAKFVARETRTVSDSHNLVYVTQKEYAIVDKADKWVRLVGSDDATTCHIVVLHNRADSRVCLSHLDSGDCTELLARMVLDVLGDSSSLDLSLIGGYLDDRLLSENLTFELLQFFKHLPVNINLNLACVASINTSLANGIPHPVVYGVCYDVKNDELYPAKFSLAVRGPLMDLRSARFLSKNPSLYRVYSSDDSFLRIDPFDYRYSASIIDWLKMNDNFILHNFSTSPQVEPPHFVQEIRKVFKFVVQNPFPLHNIFKSRKPLLFKANSQGEWIRQ